MDLNLLLQVQSPSPFRPMESERETEPLQTFPISKLPGELRQQIYEYYFASLPIQKITCDNAQDHHHTLTDLYLSAPFFATDLAPSLFYKHATFSFEEPADIEPFAITIGERRTDVKKVKVLYGHWDQPSRDWVYLLTSNFGRLEEMTFNVERQSQDMDVGHRCLDKWWWCVKEAIREGMTAEGAGSRKRRMKLTIENGDWHMDEILCR